MAEELEEKREYQERPAYISLPGESRVGKLLRRTALADQPNAIFSVRVVKEEPHQVSFEVDLFYNNAENVAAHLFPGVPGTPAPLPTFGHLPANVHGAGRHTVQLRLTSSKAEKWPVRTNQLIITMVPWDTKSRTPYTIEAFDFPKEWFPPPEADPK